MPIFYNYKNVPDITEPGKTLNSNIQAKTINIYVLYTLHVISAEIIYLETKFDITFVS